MTKLLAMPSSDNIESLKPYADGFLFGICDWSVNTPFNISLEKLKKIKDNCENKEIFVSLNKNIYSYELQTLEKILLQLEKININGIFYADTCLIQLKKKLHLKTPLIWAQEHLTTNYETINFWKKYGVSGTYLSPEITLEEIKEIRNHTKVKLFVPIFGYMPMFTSKRHIIKNYLDHFKLDSKSNIYYMKKEKIPIPVSTLVLMIVTITYKLVLVVVGLGLVLFGQGFIHKYLWSIRHIFYLGTALNVFCVTAMLVLVFHPVLARAILVKGMALLEKLHFLRHKRSRLEKLNASMDQYRDTAVYLKEHRQVIVNVFAITMFQRFALFTATWFVYKAFGLSDAKAIVVITLQAVIAVSVDMLPLPGGMGISEKLFTMIFIPVFGSHLLLPGMILSRGLGYYTELGLSAILTIVANFTIGRKKREIKC